MTTVNLSGTWSEKQRPNNGLERVAGYVHGNRLARIPVVGYIEFHQYTEKLTGNVLTVSIPAIEPALNGDGTDPTGAGEQIFQILDQLRKAHGKGSVADTLFSVPRESFDYDGQDGEMDGQQELRPLGPDGKPLTLGKDAGGLFWMNADGERVDVDAAEIRLGPDGPREVPEASGEELLAEREEAKAKPTTDPFKAGGDEA